MKLRTTLLAAIAALPLLAGGASAHGWRGDSGYGYGQGAWGGGYGQDWRQQEMRREWAHERRAREMAWQRRAWFEQERAEAARRQFGGWGPRW